MRANRPDEPGYAGIATFQKVPGHRVVLEALSGLALHRSGRAPRPEVAG